MNSGKYRAVKNLAVLSKYRHTISFVDYSSDTDMHVFLSLNNYNQTEMKFESSSRAGERAGERCFAPTMPTGSLFLIKDSIHLMPFCKPTLLKHTSGRPLFIIHSPLFTINLAFLHLLLEGYFDEFCWTTDCYQYGDPHDSSQDIFGRHGFAKPHMHAERIFR